VFGFNCHANVVAVFYELEHYPARIIGRLPASPTHYQSLGPLAPKPYTYKVHALAQLLACCCVHASCPDSLTLA
jgi:hypothetical protein